MIDVIAPTRDDPTSPGGGDGHAPTRPVGRSEEDVLGRTVRVALGGKTYLLPVRSIKANREWKAALSERFASLLSGLDAAEGMDVFGLLEHQADDLIDLLLSYDTGHVLPTKEEIEDIEPDASRDLVAAVREVWRAANPLVVTALARMRAEGPASSTPTSSPPVSMAGRRRKSRSA